MVLLHTSKSARTSLCRTPLVTALLCAGLLGAAPAYAATITVDSIADTTGDPAICTLRDAMQSANTNAVVGGCASGAAGLDTIHFNIPGAGVHTIVLSSVLPGIFERVIINGYSQPGAAPNSITYAYPAGGAIDAQIMVEIDGNGLGGSWLFNVADVAANQSSFSGLSVGNYMGGAAFVLNGTANIIGNFIGVRADGTTAFPNNNGILVFPAGGNSVIGSAVVASNRNLIARSVSISGATGVVISGNLIGTDKSGTTLMGGVLGSGGIDVSAAAANQISNNVINVGQAIGIWLRGASNTGVLNNLIGVGNGGVALGNQIGISIDNANGATQNNTIVNNTIANSVEEGIWVQDVTGSGALDGNRLDLNSIYGNGFLGINLQASAEAQNTVTNNDANDTDVGPNGLQNFPLITSAQVNGLGGIDIAFTLNSAPNALFSVTGYANPVSHSSGFGEGRYAAGFSTVASTDASGNASGVLTVPAPLPTGWAVGQFVALLARHSTTNDTSEFSASTTVAPFVGGNQPPVAVNDSYATPYQTPLTVVATGVLANDSDPDGNPFTAVLNASPTHGTLTNFNADGGFTYTPTGNYSGPDSFSYYANDGTVNSASAATVNITVGAAANNPPVAANDSYATPFNTTLTVAANGVLANDSDPDGNAITAVLNAGPGNGTLTLNANGGFVYTPTAGYSGADSFTYYANDGTVISASAATVNITVGAAPPPPPSDPTPTITPLTIPPSCGFSALPPIVNLSLGEGPAFAADMVGILSNTVGEALVFVEQNVCGTVTLSGFKGGKLAFIPHTFQAGDTRANGVYPVGNGQYQVVRNTQSLVIAPALVHVEQITALLPGVAAKQVDSGVMTATFNGVNYVVQAGVAVQLDTATGGAQLLLGSDGLFHFIDALGHNQALYPAFADPATLRGILLGLDPNATLNIELDGTATIVLNGQQYTLVPDLTLSSTPADRAGQSWWQESATRYWVVNVQSLGTAQGFTVKP